MTRSGMKHLAVRRLANQVPNASTLRNAGARGAVRAAREFLYRVDIGRFAAPSATVFLKTLDSHTEGLVRALPRGARHWGLARKVLNLFLAEATANQIVRRGWRLSRVEPWLEVPLDTQVAEALKRDAGLDALPPWRGVFKLRSTDSTIYQNVARRVARRKGLHRVRLDLVYWTRDPRGI
jgi:hypothetical protein